ncbi:NADH-quinone oxidoreductase subunit C [Ehrlichia ruminantium]|uniref:NADH-quinone oxidoreductase subunit C n=1 Tax=Ehrlichia ruminantium (strain Welgevonden) TaxID=254945 RepID=A0A0H3LZ24_EHRRW|nr:NADH-quinone oxidoreductase subunit C [Ehrlichia ruminantium]QLK50382.1 NADH-quinone oxidoreductase subunit C [Ehrlichia ruminantium]QLK51306.1 NADH-quinone oxidoreductase subunit C [Ehrlichia ruminantium]QLK53142.1 NADH-quinone oxidoreductase subunit C [Ehrlichia ruminantium]QLK54981.1 NADH-quinone oxidoreductase subunit C [Ehrlichia ruminantium]QLK55899.1 NADH-quinone oxidoreductase subunit C [Ehrlichia ruminantium]
MSDIDNTLEEIMTHINTCLNVKCIAQDSTTLEFYSTPQDIHNHILFLCNDRICKFQILIDIFIVDYPHREARFEIIYSLLSIANNIRIFCKVSLHENENITSITNIFNAAGWFEREAFDMYGILFTNNPDLRRILTDYGFSGHPMLKDFPLSGYKEVRYDIAKKEVIYEPVNLQQDFRSFDFLSPWKEHKP